MPSRLITRRAVIHSCALTGLFDRRQNVSDGVVDVQGLPFGAQLPQAAFAESFGEQAGGLAAKVRDQPGIGAGLVLAFAGASTSFPLVPTSCAAGASAM
jgi:hypothetical protein